MEKYDKGWVVINENHPSTGRAFIVADSFAYLRKDAIKKFCEGSGNEWKYWHKKFNFKCVKAQSFIQTL
jgi:hypothetical protein